MKLRREILALALPAIATNISVPLLGLTDTAVTGHIGGSLYLPAIALAGTVFNMIYWLFSFLRMGASGLTSQAYGAGDRDTASVLLWRSTAIGIACACVLLALQDPVIYIAGRFMDADDAVAPLAAQYIRICIWGAPAVIASYAMSGWLVGMQDTRTPLWVSIGTNILNIALSVGLVFGAGWKIDGVATATLISQWAGVLVTALIIMRKHRPDIVPIRRIFARGELVPFFRINADAFLRTLCLIAVTVWFTRSGAAQSADTLGANAVLLQLFMLFSYFMDGFAYAGEALCGKYTGRSDIHTVDRLVRTLNRIGLVLAAVFAALYAGAGELFIRLITDSPDIRTIATRYLPWAAAIPPCAYAAFIYDGVFIGITRTRLMLAAMTGAIAVFFTIWLALHKTLANHALWLAFDAYLLTRGALSAILYRRIRQK